MARQHHAELTLQAGPGDVGIPTPMDRLYSPNEADIVLGVAALDLRERSSLGRGPSWVEYHGVRYYKNSELGRFVLSCQTRTGFAGVQYGRT